MSELSFPAGPQLDALLAEHLFGWREVQLFEGQWIGLNPILLGLRMHINIFEYSSADVYVGDILTAMLAKGYVPTIHRLDDGRINVWMATRENRHGEATCDTLAHAVALAAARALGIPQPETEES